MKLKIWCAEYSSHLGTQFFSFWAKSKGPAMEHAQYLARMEFNLSLAPSLKSESYELVDCKLLKNGNPFVCGRLASKQSDLMRRDEEPPVAGYPDGD